MAAYSARNDHYMGGDWKPEEGPMKIMVIGAHPDDCDLHFGGSAIQLAAKGARIQFVSLTNGEKGHPTQSHEVVAKRRYGETQDAAKVYGIEKYLVLGYTDCEFEATMEIRRRLMGVVRAFGPHMIVTHRICDYHADHRAVSQLVMDMTYLLGVPSVYPEYPAQKEKPMVFFMRDSFRKPSMLSPDLVIPMDDATVARHIEGLACHRSQFFEWLPYDKNLDPAEVPSPEDKAAVHDFIYKYWVAPRAAFDAERFHLSCKTAEVFELSEYGREPTEVELKFLRGEG